MRIRARRNTSNPSYIGPMTRDQPLDALQKAVSKMSFLHAVGAIVALYFGYNLLVVLYRISPFHPLASFPGPKIAHATVWYRTYYELFKGGVMSAKLKELHDKYGSLSRKHVEPLLILGQARSSDLARMTCASWTPMPFTTSIGQARG